MDDAFLEEQKRREQAARMELERDRQGREQQLPVSESGFGQPQATQPQAVYPSVPAYSQRNAQQQETQAQVTEKKERQNPLMRFLAAVTAPIRALLHFVADTLAQLFSWPADRRDDRQRLTDIADGKIEREKQQTNLPFTPVRAVPAIERDQPQQARSQPAQQQQGEDVHWYWNRSVQAAAVTALQASNTETAPFLKDIQVRNDASKALTTVSAKDVNDREVSVTMDKCGRLISPDPNERPLSPAEQRLANAGEIAVRGVLAQAIGYSMDKTVKIDELQHEEASGKGGITVELQHGENTQKIALTVDDLRKSFSEINAMEKDDPKRRILQEIQKAQSSYREAGDLARGVLAELKKNEETKVGVSLTHLSKHASEYMIAGPDGNKEVLGLTFTAPNYKQQQEIGNAVAAVLKGEKESIDVSLGKDKTLNIAADKAHAAVVLTRSDGKEVEKQTTVPVRERSADYVRAAAIDAASRVQPNGKTDLNKTEQAVVQIYSKAMLDKTQRERLEKQMSAALKRWKTAEIPTDKAQEVEMTHCKVTMSIDPLSQNVICRVDGLNGLSEMSTATLANLQPQAFQTNGPTSRLVSDISDYALSANSEFKSKDDNFRGLVSQDAEERIDLNEGTYSPGSQSRDAFQSPDKYDKYDGYMYGNAPGADPDANHNGILDYEEPLVDRNGNGTPDYLEHHDDGELGL